VSTKNLPTSYHPSPTARPHQTADAAQPTASQCLFGLLERTIRGRYPRSLRRTTQRDISRRIPSDIQSSQVGNPPLLPTLRQQHARTVGQTRNNGQYLRSRTTRVERVVGHAERSGEYSPNQIEEALKNSFANRFKNEVQH